jgi:hypothetical protein
MGGGECFLSEEIYSELSKLLKVIFLTSYGSFGDFPSHFLYLNISGWTT